MSLLGFVQVSDLHLLEARRPPALPNQDVFDVLLSFPLLDGFMGHDYGPLVELERFLQGLPDEQSTLLISGDLTSRGADEELAFALPFVEDLQTHNNLGLSVSGNHDQWGGALHGGGTVSTVLGRLFPSDACEAPPISFTAHGNDYRLRLFRFNTDADLPPHGGFRRRLARGNFFRTLTAYDPEHGAYEEGDIGVVVMHHSPTVPHSKWLLPAAMALDKRSKKALADFTNAYNVRVILTGHAHKEACKPVPSTPALELRCGTTTQMINPPSEVVAKLRRPPKGDNCLLLHSIEETDASIEWVARPYVLKDADDEEPSQEDGFTNKSRFRRRLDASNEPMEHRLPLI